ncbi:hypothetical protein [Onishia taeanensis]|jgi:hypothetical protein|uniref:hypothetical protein n=1 Tax=Onishia taeanensis TaxID=284577 RepID=UPI001C2E2D30|nr:hypothetical protein [Halomonas taeanensis]MDI4639274.1 hypothetical protein [Halomonas sp. BMC7]
MSFSWAAGVNQRETICKQMSRDMAAERALTLGELLFVVVESDSGGQEHISAS